MSKRIIDDLQIIYDGLKNQSGGGITSIVVDGKTYTQNHGVITLPNHPKVDFNSEGNLVITINGVTKVFTPVSESVTEPEVFYSITNVLTKCTNSNTNAVLKKDSEYVATLTANSGYKIKSVKVTMGGTVIMRTVGENLPDNVICAIEDCGFISNYDQFYNQLKYLKFLPKPIISSFNIFSSIFFGFNIYKFKPEEILMNGKIPFMFIHGSSDKLVPPKNAYDAYQLYKGKKKLLIIDGAKHMKSSIQDSKKYYNEIFSFIKENKES